ncbi:hypothetical protein LR48_Vigan02g095600 [Vigna angularis]|uniref:Uncharacterized protein n=1 Tax=Phaseolus angularis TaxID=3914 RepID=A0A0L9TWD3_PHAAN|nr:hypothetical protein LR48_Vigan02g095600 [Vigna angularis]
MESEKTSKSAKGEAATTAQRQFTAERLLGTHVGSAEGVGIFGWDEANTLFSTLGRKILDA